MQTVRSCSENQATSIRRAEKYPKNAALPFAHRSQAARAHFGPVIVAEVRPSVMKRKATSFMLFIYRVPAGQETRRERFGHFAQQSLTSTEARQAINAGKNRMAEREGFEPPIPVKVCPLSRRPVIRQ